MHNPPFLPHNHQQTEPTVALPHSPPSLRKKYLRHRTFLTHSLEETFDVDSFFLLHFFPTLGEPGVERVSIRQQRTPVYEHGMSIPRELLANLQNAPSQPGDSISSK